MAAHINEKGLSLFASALALEETWDEVDRLIEALDSKLTSLMTAHGEPFGTLKRSDTKAEIPSNTFWAHQYNFTAFKRGPGRKKPAVSLHFEVRLCWPEKFKIFRSDGSELKIPIIIVKATDGILQNEPFACFDLLISPDEIAAGYYDVHKRLLWYAEKTDKWWAAAFVLPLFSIENEDDLMTELVRPVCELAKVSWQDNPDKMEHVFKSAKSIFCWKENDRKQVVLDE
jgi:hypothetical protein